MRNLPFFPKSIFQPLIFINSSSFTFLNRMLNFYHIIFSNYWVIRDRRFHTGPYPLLAMRQTSITTKNPIAKHVHRINWVLKIKLVKNLTLSLTPNGLLHPYMYIQCVLYFDDSVFSVVCLCCLSKNILMYTTL